MSTSSTIPIIQVESGTTNISLITWIKYGHVANISVMGASSTGGASTTITGLPKPKNGAYQLSKLSYGSNHVGDLEFYNDKWIIQTSAIAYGSLTYICE